MLRRIKIKGAWLAGAIFAVHPVHVESVAWITELKDVQSGFFYLLALLSYVKFDLEHKRKWYGVALAMFLLALLSKTDSARAEAVIEALANRDDTRDFRIRLLRLLIERPPEASPRQLAARVKLAETLLADA